VGFIFLTMSYSQLIITILAGMAGLLALTASLINKRIDDLSKRIDRLEEDTNRRFNELKEDIREVRQLLYKLIGEPTKKG